MTKFTIHRKYSGDIIKEFKSELVEEELIESSKVLSELRFTSDSKSMNVSSEFVWSKYQQDIFRTIEEQVNKMKNGIKPDNIICEAGAGCAKTTTLINSLNYISSNFDVAFLAFNKEIVETMKTKVSLDILVKIKISTFHSLGFNVLRNTFRRVQLNDKKMNIIYNNLCNSMPINRYMIEEVRSPYLKLTSLIKNTCLEPSDENLMILIEKFNVDIGNSDEDVLFSMIRKGLIVSNRDTNIIDFNDMIYLPIILGLSFHKFDVCFVDELQDLNNSQLIMLQKSVKDKGFIVCVGDRNQSIYGFRGADVDAIPRMFNELKAKMLPLQMTYRCGKNIVKLANKLVPQLEAFEKNLDGEVKNIDYDKFYEIINEGDMVLCRNNAPLVKPVFKLLAEGKKCAIKGRDIGEGLINLIKKLKVNNIDSFYDKLEEWRDKELERANRKKSGSLKESVQDKYDCLIAISNECDTIDEIIRKIGDIFSDNKVAITFSSVHKAKGLEANKVYILEPNLMPSKYASKDWEVVQERNIMYVAITRTKSNLYIVNGKLNIQE